YAAVSVTLKVPHVAVNAAAYTASAVGDHAARLVAPGEAYRASTEAQAEEKAALCVLLRDVLGNPFRPPPPRDSSLLTWNGGGIPHLAPSPYDHRLPPGTPDPARLALPPHPPPTPRPLVPD